MTVPPAVLEPQVLLRPEQNIPFFKPFKDENNCKEKEKTVQKELPKTEPKNEMKKILDKLDEKSGLQWRRKRIRRFIVYDGIQKKSHNCINVGVYKKGRWSKDEHERFLEGIRRLGKGRWAEIAERFVISRSRVQVASHAQKFCLD